MKTLSFRYKLLLSPLLFLLFFIFTGVKDYYLSNYINKQLVSINSKEVWLNNITQKISTKITLLGNNFVLQSLQNKIDQQKIEKVKRDFGQVIKFLTEIENSDFSKNKQISKHISMLKKRLKGYMSILLDLPQEYKEDKIDAMYAIISLNSVYSKIQKDIGVLHQISKDKLTQKILKTKKMITDNRNYAIYSSIVILVILLLFGRYMVDEIVTSTAKMKKLNRSFNDFLHKKSEEVLEIDDFPKDEIGEILFTVNDNIIQSKKYILEERRLKDEIENFNSNLEKKINDATKEIKDLNTEIESTLREVIFVVGTIGEERSKETGLHVRRVAEYSFILASLYGLPRDEALLLKDVSPMHDIGKIGIPDSILNKPAKLTQEEFEVMKNHTKLGYQILSYSDKDIFKAASIVAYEHHEKWDGSGYPRGLKGEEIHIYGRITAIADVFDALGSDRIYKKAWDINKIMDLFKREQGKHFDPELVTLFIDNIPHFLAARENIEQFGNNDTLDKFILSRRGAFGAPPF